MPSDSIEAEGARRRLHDALRAVRSADRQVPCEVTPQLWTSNIRSEREAAGYRCRSCPVRVQCVEASEFERVGVWGGNVRAAGSLEW
ncbi:WhiB family transcriptional regulator [Allobranchiibius sp. GilTou38]|uniref:WhiB family transcriptional regulator n=1 Tax=Allobranchiibius sp. GilTou38 TaxID=2815210 RepID=UPI001AA1B049|nr:WhiB family transcriptional regulator [Allobranchiibius sp. GilTou38]MBO1767718.1 WhiB family transcriptional regulator [Allobranchiibius sp. GilTou38]